MRCPLCSGRLSVRRTLSPTQPAARRRREEGWGILDAILPPPKADTGRAGARHSRQRGLIERAYAWVRVKGLPEERWVARERRCEDCGQRVRTIEIPI